MPTVFLNGKFLPDEQAKISVFDRGFLLGDGIYEVIPVYSGKLFRLGEHLARLQNSLDEIKLQNPLSYEEWASILNSLVEKNYATELSIYLQITRGIAARDHAFPADIRPTIFAMANTLKPVDINKYLQGVSAITVEDNRWLRCNIKAISLLPNVLLRQQAVEQNVEEAILHRNGHVTEGAACNVIAVFKGEIVTPPKSPELLLGITRDLILELADENGLSSSESDISLGELGLADEIWLTSSTKEILPVTRLDGSPVGNGKPGEVWATMRKIYNDYKKTLH